MSGDPFGVIGSVIDGQFRVDQWVGEGGFSSVYKGFHLGLQEPIAIKCLKLPQSLGRDVIEQFQNRFRDESRIAYRLSQGNLHIVRSITSGTTTSPAGQVIPYMVLEWLDGLTLSQDLKKRRDAGMKGRPIEEVIQMFAPASEALAYAHAHGVVHRDIKPGNLFLAQTREGFRLKVLDFGMAKILSDGNLGIAPMAVSTAGIVVFSAPYAAPEQFDPKVGSIGTWTDVYSLALVLLEALTDKRVRNADSIAECLMAAVDPAQIPTPKRIGLNVSSALDEVFARALAVNPRERAQDVGEFWGQLRNAMLRDAEEISNADADSIPPGIDGDSPDDASTIVAESALFDEQQDEPTRNVDLNSPQFQGAGGLPPEVKDFLSRAQQQSARSQDSNNQTMAMQPPAAGAPWPPPPLPAAGRPAPAGQGASGLPNLGFPMDSEGEPATMAMHSPLANQTFNPNLPPGSPGGPPDPFAQQNAQLSSPQFKNAAALGMTMPLINNGPGMFPPPGMPTGQFQPAGQPPQQGGYPGPAPALGGPPPPLGPALGGPPLGAPPIQSAVNSGGYVAQGAWPPPPGNAQAAPGASSKMPIILGAIVAAIVVLGGGLYFAVRWYESRQEASSVTASDSGATVVDITGNGGTIPTAVATDPNAIPSGALTAPTAALTAPTAPTAALTAPTVDTSTAVTPTATATATATAHPTAANTATNNAHPTPTAAATSTATHTGPTPLPTPTAANDGQFDPAAAQRSLHGMESILVSCKQPNGPTGAGQVKVTFANDGSAMSSVILGPPYQGTPVGDCAASRMKLARVPKFDGPPGISTYTFHIPK
jgi:serine/threonine protein kinase